MLKRPQSGLTLIELMVGLAILAMLMLAGIPSFSSFLQNRTIRNTAEAVANGLNLAKSEAVRRNTGIRFSLGTTGDWTVGCLTVVPTVCPASIQTRPTPAGTGTISTTAVNIDFSGYGQVTSTTVNATIDVVNTLGTCEDVGGTMRCLRLIVSPGGRIRMCDPKLTTGAVQACL